jgi:HAD superfamily hydrolase (TIGR01509 family)
VPASRDDEPIEDVVASFDLVIFDCDGVLVDSEMLAADCLARLLTAHGRETDLQDVFARYLGRSMSAVASDYHQALGRPLPENFGADMAVELRRRFENDLKPISGIAAVLDRLAVPYCLASSSGPERIALSLRITGLDRYFAGRIFDASMVPHGKPAPDLFLHAAARMGAAPAGTLVIEDSGNGVRAGKAAGMTVWGFTGGSHHAFMDGEAELAAAGADRVFRDMSRFSAD